MSKSEKILEKYFSSVSDEKKEKILKLSDVYREVNNKINIISRADIENVLEKHILTALSIARAKKFRNGAKVLDIGSGGGLPGIPLSIIFEDCKFTLSDSRKKKCEAMEMALEELNLKNVEIINKRSNEIKEKFDFVVGRAVTEPSEFMKLAKKNLKVKDGQAFYISGDNENYNGSKIAISDIYDEEYFENKYIYVYP
ncbi:16S rRNA (guanine(527)-N(7))-methyltransferase RsmG [Candidatus Parcubacteria bacterium]|nr:MAG: 16S rRNA (guanine(527)-N(7))-methyltransferase RsmG [Candidatus Parcubacteria bacterium]